ncbi:LysR family transcriptional regulator [Rhizobium sp. P44RR-XXIV]|uniref:LysR family transcriptional regulator n=1 Tax=Rhizobium sp. P44RR-XXIV TaxID=1921145 RepID=UPI000984E4B8|nr:LysR family transcriptional regulator [Rhizobium sp. P44RR-XXIV]TIX87498.1 LysR family transcriptional regulator [Rhizobium sp. P44RR-XXIV]
MHSPNINSIDLNLLRVFDAVFREGNILRAAQRLGMSQPAASHALARLRHALDDDLFVRSAQGMLPTSRAEQLAEPIRQALSYLELGLQSGPFEPATSKQKFKLAVDNCSAIALTSKIVLAVGAVAPGISLNLRPSGTADIDRMIDASELDLFIGRPGEDRERFASEDLSSDDFVIVHRSELRKAQTPMTAEELIGKPHLHLSSAGDDTGFLDRWLGERQMHRDVKHSVPLLGCTDVLSEQDIYVPMRRPIAEAICKGSRLAISELPFISPRIATCMRWHRRLDSQPAHIWLRDAIRSAVASRSERPIRSQ